MVLKSSFVRRKIPCHLCSKSNPGTQAEREVPGQAGSRMECRRVHGALWGGSGHPSLPPKLIKMGLNHFDNLWCQHLGCRQEWHPPHTSALRLCPTYQTSGLSLASNWVGTGPAGLTGVMCCLQGGLGEVEAWWWLQHAFLTSNSTWSPGLPSPPSQRAHAGEALMWPPSHTLLARKPQFWSDGAVAGSRATEGRC